MDNSFFVEKLNMYYDNNTVNRIIDGLIMKKKTTFRVNHIKSNTKEIEEELKRLSIKFDKSEEYEDAFIIDDDIIIEAQSIYESGKIYVQSLSSMKPVYELMPQAFENILDMCAAPGSKTTMIQSISSNKVNLTACELHNDRFQKLEYNCKLQGTNAYLLNQNALQFNDMLKFDKILLDAPCSGSGTLDISNDNYKKYFTDTLINKCVDTQKKLIKKAYKLLKKGGLLVYSTCSLLNCENEEMIEVAENEGFGLEKIGEKNFIKIFPSDIYEGFFIAKFIKK